MRKACAVAAMILAVALVAACSNGDEPVGRPRGNAITASSGLADSASAIPTGLELPDKLPAFDDVVGKSRNDQAIGGKVRAIVGMAAAYAKKVPAADRNPAVRDAFGHICGVESPVGVCGHDQPILYSPDVIWGRLNQPRGIGGSSTGMQDRVITAYVTYLHLRAQQRKPNGESAAFQLCAWGKVVGGLRQHKVLSPELNRYYREKLGRKPEFWAGQTGRC